MGTKYLNTRIYFLLIQIVLSSLLTNLSKAQNNNAYEGKILFSPVYLNQDSVALPVSDYLSLGEKAEGAYGFKGVLALLSKDKSMIILKSNFAENWSFFILKSGNINYYIPVKNVRKIKIDLTVPKLANQMFIKADFTNWQEVALDEDDLNFQKRLSLEPGDYQYQLIVNGKAMIDSSNPLYRSNGMGGFNSILQVKEASKSNSGNIEVNKNTIKLNDQVAFSIWDNTEIFSDNYSSTGNFVALPAKAKALNRSYLRVYFNNGNEEIYPIQNGQFITNPKLLTRNDLHKTIMYFMMVDRFYDANKNNNFPVKDPDILPPANYYGGDIEGITKKINTNYFKKLGVNALWISPISQNPLGAWGQLTNPNTKFSGYHGYWPTSSSLIDSRFGNSTTLNQFLSVSHKYNYNVYLDYVAHHVHLEHPVYKKHPDWVTPLYLPDGNMNTEKWDEYRLTTWFDTFMPTLDLARPEVAKFMADSALFWLKTYNFDGFRHDATKHIPDNFTRLLTQRIKNEIALPNNKTIYQIGETYGNPNLIGSYLGTGLLDGQFDFNLFDAALAAFTNKNEGFDRLAKEQERSLRRYGAHHLMGNISGNQDKPRFMSYADGTLPGNYDWMGMKRLGFTNHIEVKNDTAYLRMQLFMSYNLTIPGIPVIYYGDEIGMPGAGDPDCRRMMQFDGLNSKQIQLKKYVTNLCKLRQNSMALMYGSFEIVYQDSNLFIYKRNYLKETVYVAINKGTEAAKFTNTEIAALWNKNTEIVKINLFNSGKHQKTKQKEFNIPGLSTEIYLVKNK